MMTAWRSKQSCSKHWMSGLVGISGSLILRRPIFRGNVSAFSVTLSEKVVLRLKRNSRKPFRRGLRERPRAPIDVLRPLPTCFAHVERTGNMVSRHGKNSRRKCATQSACAVEIYEIVEWRDYMDSLTAGTDAERGSVTQVRRERWLS